MGVLMEIEPRYDEGRLTETRITIRTDKNHFFEFLGPVPDNLLGRIVDFEERVTREDKQYYYIEQTIGDLEPVRFRYKDHRFVSGDIPEELGCQQLIRTKGKLAK